MFQIFTRPTLGIDGNAAKVRGFSEGDQQEGGQAETGKDSHQCVRWEGIVVVGVFLSLAVLCVCVSICVLDGYIYESEQGEKRGIHAGTIS